jgi:hypothetical protein
VCFCVWMSALFFNDANPSSRIHPNALVMREHK